MAFNLDNEESGGCMENIQIKGAANRRKETQRRYTSTLDVDVDTSLPELDKEDPVVLKLGKHSISRPSISDNVRSNSAVRPSTSELQTPPRPLIHQLNNYHSWLAEHGLKTVANPVQRMPCNRQRHFSDGDRLQDKYRERSPFGNLEPNNFHRERQSSNIFRDKYRLKLTRENENRYDSRGDGEVTKMGGGESYRPSARPRSAVRDNSRGRYDRDRSTPRRDRSRARTPPRARSRGRTPSDSYHPRDRSPRRRSRSRSPMSYRPRDRTPPRDIPNWRVRDRARSPPSRARTPPRDRPRSPPPRMRSPPRARSPIRERARTPPHARSPPPRRYSPRRDDDRRERMRSPLTDDLDSRDLRRRTRSRSPFDNRMPVRTRSPPPKRRSPPAGPRAPDWRARSRSPRRDNVIRGPTSITWRRRSPSPPPAADKSSGKTSADNSRRNSPPSQPSRATLTTLRDPAPRTRELSPTSHRDSARGTPRDRSPAPARAPSLRERSPYVRSPPRGPAGLRAPTGPSASRNLNSPATPSAPTGISIHTRPDNSPIAPPSGPRGYNASVRGGFAPRGRGGSFASPVSERRESTGSWGAAPPARATPVVSPTLPSPSGSASNNIPTGPRASVTPSADWPSKPWPSGPSQSRSASISSVSTTFPPSRSQHFSSASSNSPIQPRVHPAIANLPPIIPGGKIDPSASGIPRDLEERIRKREEETERLRNDLMMKEEKMRKSLRQWETMERENRENALRGELSERHVRVLAGEGSGGAAF